MRINTSATLVALSCISINTQSALGFTVQSAKITAGFTTTQLNADQGESPLNTPRNANAGGEARPLVENLPAATGPAEVPHNSEEGSEYDGTGGMGLANGTTNTWVIPGMDEMTGEEYRKALQESVSDRQSRRKAGDIVGNMQSNNYLDSL